MSALERRLAKLETGAGRDPTLEDWIAVLDAPDHDAALKDLNRRFPPAHRSQAYREFWDKLQ